LGSVNVTHTTEFISGDSPVRIGNQFPVTISTLTNTHVARYTLATATNKILLSIGSAATDDIADFDYLVIISDQDLLIEWYGTSVSSNANAKLKANIPFILGYSTTLAYDAAGTFAGASQAITRITVRNNSGSTANIQLFAAT